MSVESKTCQDDKAGLNVVSPSIELPGLRRPMKTNGPYAFSENEIKTIERSQVVRVLDSAPTIWENGGIKIVRIADNAVVKYGYDVKLLEARNMAFVAQHTTIRLPQVFDAWVENEDKGVDDETGICFIVMSYIDGWLLDEVWSELHSTHREDIQKQLHYFIRELRKTESEYPGPVGGGVCQGAFFTDYGAGPFSSKEEMETWFDERLAVCRDFGVADQAQRGFRGEFQRLVMCHMDLHPRNIILDCDRKIWLIDWAYAGMYPAYFETATILRHGRDPYFERLLDLLGDEEYKEATDRLFAISFALTTGALCKPSIKCDVFENTS
ncbi:hypothetical protein N7532_002993 [Penicillium argentinense]|uniref:Aminoglycoside phosphotransferase domain-containing protein n=1 Tax=Penicillium argentinense TaxID=1131581 RepID=A0A9W9KDK9_9EURO|nr:uncharacterized protein N7532_002993 [Penicillium argentinense]KAJ5102464.1 hypothetical protein N7532_002993 [Penicillium argentinense]